jgi:hypothetical protein
MQNDSLYLMAVTWSFLAMNAIRLLAYLPTITKLAQPGCTGDGQSQLTWALGALSNATLTLHLFEQHQRHVDTAVLLCFTNVVMNVVVLLLVHKAQSRTGTPHQTGDRSSGARSAKPDSSHGKAWPLAWLDRGQRQIWKWLLAGRCERFISCIRSITVPRRDSLRLISIGLTAPVRRIRRHPAHDRRSTARSAGRRITCHFSSIAGS